MVHLVLKKNSTGREKVTLQDRSLCQRRDKILEIFARSIYMVEVQEENAEVHLGITNRTRRKTSNFLAR
jgi:hypothetical protein